LFDDGVVFQVGIGLPNAISADWTIADFDLEYDFIERVVNL
jgi:hypothetical protein